MNECKPNQACTNCALRVPPDPNSPFPGICYNPEAMKGIDDVLERLKNAPTDNAEDYGRNVNEWGEERLTPQEVDALTEIVSPEKSKIVIPKFSVNAAVFIAYMTFDGDKSNAQIRAVSYPKLENLLKDLGLLMTDITARYSKEFDIHIINEPDMQCDDSDILFLHMRPRDPSKGDSMIGAISICVVPNSQNLGELQRLDPPMAKTGNLMIIPLKDYNDTYYHQAKSFLEQNFRFKYIKATIKNLPTAKGGLSRVSDKEAKQAWDSLFLYYDKYPEITYQMTQLLTTIHKEISKEK